MTKASRDLALLYGNRKSRMNGDVVRQKTRLSKSHLKQSFHLRQEQQQNTISDSNETLLNKINELKNQNSLLQKKYDELVTENRTLSRMLKIADKRLPGHNNNSRMMNRAKALSQAPGYGESTSVFESMVEDLRYTQAQSKQFQKLYLDSEKHLRNLHLQYALSQKQIRTLTNLLSVEGDTGDPIDGSDAALLRRLTRKVLDLEKQIFDYDKDTENDGRGKELHKEMLQNSEASESVSTNPKISKQKKSDRVKSQFNTKQDSPEMSHPINSDISSKEADGKSNHDVVQKRASYQQQRLNNTNSAVLDSNGSHTSKTSDPKIEIHSQSNVFKPILSTLKKENPHGADQPALKDSVSAETKSSERKKKQNGKQKIVYISDVEEITV